MKIKKFLFLAAFLTIFGINSSKAQGLGDILGGGLGHTLGNIIEGVFSSSNITIADMEGEWTSTGPAVCFQGEGFLKKAGGIAAAAAVETKLAPYYEQYGLNNATLTVNADGTFTLACKMIKLNGTITQAAGAQQGVFEFNFTALGIKLATVTTYVEKTSRTMDVMFDATKLKKLLTAVSQFSGIKVVQALSSILDSYDGLCVGFHFSGGKAQNDNSNNGFSLGSILNGLGGGSDKTNTTSGTNGTNKTNTTNKTNQSTTTDPDSSANGQQTGIGNGLDILRGILGGTKK